MSSSSSLFFLFGLGALFLVVFGCHPSARNPRTTTTTTTQAPPASGDNTTSDGMETTMTPGVTTTFTVKIYPRTSWTYPPKTVTTTDTPQSGEANAKDELLKDINDMVVSAAKEAGFTVISFGLTSELPIELIVKNTVPGANPGCTQDEAYAPTDNVITMQCLTPPTAETFPPKEVKGKFTTEKELDEKVLGDFKDELKTQMGKILPMNGEIITS